jgi:DNA-binding response OmpR family regulator
MIIPKEEIVGRFWNDSTSNSRSIDMHIKALRQKVFSKTNLQLSTILALKAVRGKPDKTLII